MSPIPIQAWDARAHEEGDSRVIHLDLSKDLGRPQKETIRTVQMTDGLSQQCNSSQQHCSVTVPTDSMLQSHCKASCPVQLT